MPALRVLLVRPTYAGNLGSVARAMANFGLRELHCIGEPPLTEAARTMAVHAQAVLDDLVVHRDWAGAVRGGGLVVGTSAVHTINDRRYPRIAITPRDLRQRLQTEEGPVTLVFGPEADGLGKEEVDRCDLLVTIPSSPDYAVLNLSHAVAILLYELYDGDIYRPAVSAEWERDILLERFSAYLGRIAYPAHRRVKTEVMFRRLVARAGLSRWEFHTLTGLFTRRTRAEWLAAGGGADRPEDDDLEEDQARPDREAQGSPDG